MTEKPIFSSNCVLLPPPETPDCPDPLPSSDKGTFLLVTRTGFICISGPSNWYWSLVSFACTFLAWLSRIVFQCWDKGLLYSRPVPLISDHCWTRNTSASSSSPPEPTWLIHIGTKLCGTILALHARLNLGMEPKCGPIAHVGQQKRLKIQYHFVGPLLKSVWLLGDDWSELGIPAPILHERDRPVGRRILRIGAHTHFHELRVLPDRVGADFCTELEPSPDWHGLVDGELLWIYARHVSGSSSERITVFGSRYSACSIRSSISSTRSFPEESDFVLESPRRLFNDSTHASSVRAERAEETGVISK